MALGIHQPERVMFPQVLAEEFRSAAPVRREVPGPHQPQEDGEAPERPEAADLFNDSPAAGLGEDEDQNGPQDQRRRQESALRKSGEREADPPAKRPSPAL